MRFHDRLHISDRVRTRLYRGWVRDEYSPHVLMCVCVRNSSIVSHYNYCDFQICVSIRNSVKINLPIEALSCCNINCNNVNHNRPNAASV